MNPVPGHIPSSLLFVDGLQINMDELQHFSGPSVSSR